MNYNRFIGAFTLALGTFSLLLAASCGGGSHRATLPAMASGGTGQAAAFSLELLEDGSSLRADAPLDLTVEESQDRALVRVVSRGSMELECLFFNLRYDAQRYTPLAAQATEAWVRPADSLTLEVLDEPGVLTFGQVPLAGKPRKAVAAQAPLAEVLFQVEPFESDAARAASQVPTNAAALSPLLWYPETGELRWYYVNPGDLNQDGIVNILDITPLAASFGDSGPFPFEDARSVIDSNHDGEVTVGDLTAIACYFSNNIDAYSLYYSENIEDVPCEYAEPSVLEPVATIPLPQALGTSEERSWFSYHLENPPENGFYWVRPMTVDEAGAIAEGIRSNLVGGNGNAMPPGPGDQPDPRFNFAPTALLNLSYEGDGVPLAVTLDARESYDLDGEILVYDWDFEGDGLYDAWGGEPEVEHVYCQAGTYAPLLRVTDDCGAYAVFQSPPFEVTAASVSNIPPVADIMASPPSGPAPLITAFFASGSHDVDGYGYIEKYEWDFDGDGTFEFDSGGDPTLFYTFHTAGTYIVSVRVTDNRGDSDTDSVEIVVTAVHVNQPPTAHAEATPLTGVVPLSVNFDASASADADGSIIEYAWDFDGNGLYEGVSDSPTVSHEYEEPGTFDAYIRVEDNEGARAATQVTIMVNVEGNAPPVADLQATPTSGDVSLTVDFDGSASYDPDGSIWRCDYDFNNDGIWDAYDSADTVSWTYTTAGNYDAKLRVTDNVGAQATDIASITVNIVGNDSPIADLQASPTSGDAPLMVDFDATGSYDPDGTVKHYDYDFDSDGIWDAYDSADAVSHRYVAPGIYDAKLRVTDDEGAQAIDIVTITVSMEDNESPIADLQATPTSGDAPLMVDFDAIGSHDPDGSVKHYDYDFDNDGIWDAYDSADAVSHRYVAPGIYDAKLRVTDDDGAQATDMVAITVNAVGNDSPIADLQATPTSGDAPLMVDFDASGSYDPDGYIKHYDYDFDNDGIWDAYDSGDTVSWTYLSAGIYGAKLRVTDDAGAQAIDTVTITVNAATNDSPVADLQATPTSGDAPLTVDFDASGSSDPDGSIIRYDYDFDNDGIWDAYDSGDTVSWTYTSAGTYDAKLRVTDNDGAFDVDTIPITVKSWHTMTVDNSPNQVGEYNSLAVVNGRPAMSYYDNTVDDLKYVRAMDASGTSWGTPLTLDSTGAVGSYTCMVIVNGNPAISYFYDSTDDLRYIRAIDADGTSWGTPVVVDTTNDVGRYNSMAIVNGNPAISYFDNTNDDLKYVRASNPNGTAWGAPVIVASAGDTGYYTCLVVVNGYPAISYFDETSDDLMYVRASDANGTAWGTPMIVDAGGNVGKYSSMTTVSGNPAIAYFDDTNDDLKYVRASDASGSAWATPLALDSAGRVGEYASLAVINGKPAISYYDRTNTNLKYIRALDADGTGWETPVTIDFITNAGLYTSLAVVNGNPAISYWDYTDLDLKYASYY